MGSIKDNLDDTVCVWASAFRGLDAFECLSKLFFNPSLCLKSTGTSAALIFHSNKVKILCLQVGKTQKALGFKHRLSV